MSKSRLPFNGDTLDDLMTGLILGLSDIARLLPLTYITRHTNDKIPPQHLAPFLTKFHEFVDYFGKNQPYNIPTVWFVGHFQDYDSIKKVRQKLDQKNLKYFEGGEEYDSFEQIGKNYCEEREDAKLFVKFLHQVTMIGIDLLLTADYKQKLKQLGRLEYMRYPDTKNVMEEVKSDLKDMERYLRQNSQYYREHIVADESEYKQFWVNFTKRKSSEAGTGSWPHFLFNICGVVYP
ncbi:MAG: hypothetical protein L6406_26220 [Desulfobacterales bacterium]|nr:hypothetical protein [Desulfobacterales bacterium]